MWRSVDKSNVSVKYAAADHEYDITEILLKVVLNTITPELKSISRDYHI
jgi:hypothetical protein